jgi:predicted metal-dependent phosphoesterase TrpH
MCTVPVFDRVCRESYNDPGEVYETLKRRGMDLVTVTDHDSIDSVETLRRRLDFFLSEEVTCTASSGTNLHMGVYGIEERDHIQMQQRRDDLPRLIAYLRERRLLFSINHVFSGLTGKRTAADFEEFALFPAIETLNGQMLPLANKYARQWAASVGKTVVGGSDAHTMQSLGRTWTKVPGASTAADFLDGLKNGAASVDGESGTYAKLNSAVVHIAAAMIREQHWTVALTPFLGLLPFVLAGNLLREIWFAHTWGRRVQRMDARVVAQPAVCAIE